MTRKLDADDLKLAEVARAFIKSVAQDIKHRLPEGYGFTLHVFSYGEHGVSSYASTAAREDAIKTLRELIEQLEEGQD